MTCMDFGTLAASRMHVASEGVSVCGGGQTGGTCVSQDKIESPCQNGNKIEFILMPVLLDCPYYSVRSTVSL